MATYPRGKNAIIYSHYAKKRNVREVAGSLPAAWAIAQTHIFIDLLANNDFDFKLKKNRKIKYCLR